MFEWDRINNDIKSCLLSPGLQAKIECLEKLIEKYGDDGMIYMALGDLYLKSKDYEKARSMYEKAARLFPLVRYMEMAKGKMRTAEQLMHTARYDSITDEELIEQHEEKTVPAEDDALYIVNCTKKKIWDEDPNAPSFVPAILAYRGTSFTTFLEYVTKNNVKWWLILSAKYGFIEPWHPIENYNVSFNKPDTGPITDDALRNQVLYQTRWNYTGSPRKLNSFKTIHVYATDIYYEKITKAFENIAEVKKLVISKSFS